MQKPIPLKGKLPTKPYRIALNEVYAKHANKTYSHQLTDQLLSRYRQEFLDLDTKIISKIFPEAVIQENRGFDRLPCVLGEAPPTKFDFNLRYQDTRLKLAVEEKLNTNGEPSRYEKEAQVLMEIVSILLRTPGIQRTELW